VTNTITVVPLVGGLLAAILLAEPITLNLAIGLVAVVAGIWLATMGVPGSPTASSPPGR
jgi:drug/metabolite transporter (DMT)-like permease